MEDKTSSPASTSSPEAAYHRSTITAQTSSFVVAPEVINSNFRDLYNVTVLPSAANTKPAKPASVGPNIERIKENLKRNFRRKYEMIFEGIAKRAQQTSLNEIYTELLITEGESEGLNKDHEIGQIDAMLKAHAEQGIPVKCKDIFKPLNNQRTNQTEDEKAKAEETLIRTVLTVGIAGIGKTVSVQKFVLDWAEREANQDIDLLLVLPFRELNSVKNKKQSLHELLLDFHSELNEIEDPKCYDDCKILFIFDGLDESQLPLAFGRRRVSDVSKAASLDELMTNLIEGNLLPKALVWITSRLAAIDKIPEDLIHRMTEVRGFTDEQKQEYFRKKVSDKSLAERIISHVKRSKTLEIMCHIPIFCWITATVLEQILKTGKKKIPSSLTELYTRFLLTQTSVKRKKYCGETGSNLLKLSDKDVQLILKLGKLAFENLQEKIIVFSEDDLKRYDVDVTEASLMSGVFTEIIKEEDPMFPVKKYSFVHLSFQEYLAAVYVVHTYADTGVNAMQASQMEHAIRFFKRLLFFQQDMTLYDLHKCAIDKALKSESGHLDLFLRFLLGLSLESSQKLLESFSMSVDCEEKNIQQTIQYLKSKLREEDRGKISSSERCINLIHCLQELGAYSVEEEIRRWISDLKSEHKFTEGQIATIVGVLAAVSIAAVAASKSRQRQGDSNFIPKPRLSRVKTESRPRPGASETMTRLRPEAYETETRPRSGLSKMETRQRSGLSKMETRQRSETETRPKPAASEAETRPRPAVSEAETRPRPAASETETRPRPGASEAETRPRPAASEAETTPRPAVSEAETRPRPAASEAETRPRPGASEVETRLRPGASEAETRLRPAASEVKTTPRPAASETETRPRPVASETETRPRPAVSETETRPRPGVSETETRSKPGVSETETRPRPETSETETRARSGLSKAETR